MDIELIRYIAHITGRAEEEVMSWPEDSQRLAFYVAYFVSELRRTAQVKPPAATGKNKSTRRNARQKNQLP